MFGITGTLLAEGDILKVRRKSVKIKWLYLMNHITKWVWLWKQPWRRTRLRKRFVCCRENLQILSLVSTLSTYICLAAGKPKQAKRSFSALFTAMMRAPVIKFCPNEAMSKKKKSEKKRRVCSLSFGVWFIECYSEPFNIFTDFFFKFFTPFIIITL